MLELGSLVRRDHDDLHYALRIMQEPLSDRRHVVEMVERLQFGFAAHAEAETRALGAMLELARPAPAIYLLVSQVIASHLAQETALGDLVRIRPGTPAFRERACYLRQLMVHHADHEDACLQSALSDDLSLDVFRTLSAAYVSERDRLLAQFADGSKLRSVG